MSSSSSNSNVGNRQLYEAGDERTYSQAELEERREFGKGDPHAHQTNDPKDQQNLSTRAERERLSEKDEGAKSEEAEQYKKDPTLPARSHGNEPSKGAKIDAELKEEEEEELRKKGRA